MTDDPQGARDATRWFPAMVSNHVMDLDRALRREPEIPKDLTEYVKARKFSYEYNRPQPQRGPRTEEFVTDEIADRFSVIGDVDAVRAKLRELDSVGVDHFNIYLMTQGQEDILAAYGKDIIPELKQAAV